MHVFYEPRIRETLTLSAEESRHAVNVLRMKTGDVLYVNDGNGNLFRSQVAEALPKHVKIENVERVETKTLERFIHIAIGITRQADRLEWFVEKATEIGVRQITLLITQNTARHKVNVDRLNKIAIAALKQSGNVFLPIISSPTRFETFIDQPPDSLKLICSTAQEIGLKNVVAKHMNVTALIGPEGDFTEDEIKLAIGNGYQPVSLGPYRLRTETAALTAASTLASM